MRTGYGALAGALLIAAAAPALAQTSPPPQPSPVEPTMPAPAATPAPTATPAPEATPSPPPGSTAYLQTIAAADAGANEQASRGFRALLAANPTSRIVATRALDHGLNAGDWALAVDAARRLDALNALPGPRRMLLLAEALRGRNWRAAEAQIARIEQERGFSILAPVLRAWVAFGSRRGDPIALLQPMEQGELASYAAEHRALLQLARGQGDLAVFSALDPELGLRMQRLRIAAAAEFAARGQREQALGLLTSDQPAIRAARAMIEARRTIPGRINTAADGVGELLARIAIDFSQQNLANEGAMLTRIAAYLSPTSSEPLIIGAELLATSDVDGALRLLRAIPAGDPFVRPAADTRLRLLAQANRSEEAIAEARAVTGAGSTNPADWMQLGDQLIGAQRNAEAVTAYRRGYELWRAGTYPDMPEWVIQLALGSALERSGDWAGGLAALREAYRLAPDEPLVLNYLGYAQLDRHENLDEAERLVRRASELAPNNPAITDSLGWALYRRGRVTEALPILERAARGAPDDPEINEHLGDVYYAAGRRIEARQAWRAALVRAEGDAVARIRGKIDVGLPPQRTAQR